MPPVKQNAQKDHKPHTEETQADNPYHNEAFPKSKMPKKAHKPSNIPACKNSHLPIIEVFPTARSPRKPNPTYILPKVRTKISSGHCGLQNTAFHKQLWADVVVQAQRQMWWSCMEQHDNIPTLYCLVKTPSDALNSKLALARTCMGPYSPSALHSEKASTCSPQRPRRQHQPNSKGLCHNAYSAAHGKSTAYLHVSAVRANSLAPRHIWIHGSIYWSILENKKGSILTDTLKKSLILIVILEKSWILCVKLQKKRFNSLSHIRKKSSFFGGLFFRLKVQFLESYFLCRKSSIL